MATQMQQAREGRTTDAMKIVAEEERIPVETIRERVANGTIAICANINHKNLRPRGVGDGGPRRRYQGAGCIAASSRMLAWSAPRLSMQRV